MKVLLVTGPFPPAIGGPATYVVRLREALAARGHEVTIVTTSHGPAEPRVTRIAGNGIARHVRTVARIAALARDADVILANSLHIHSVAANFAARKPLVLKVVGDYAWERAVARQWTNDTFDSFQTRRQRTPARLLRLIRNGVTRRAKHCVVPSEYLAKIVSAWGVDRDRITVIRNAIPAMPANGGSAASSSRVRIITVGRLVPWKHVDGIIRAVTAVPGTDLTVVGDGPERAALEDLTADLALGSRVRFTGAVDAEGVQALLQASDIFVLHSTYEGLPHVLLEAMHGGLAVVARPAGGVIEVVHNNVNGLLVEDDTELQAALTRLAGDPGLRRNLGAAARAHVAAEFDAERMFDETIRLLQREAVV
jgi:glycosyltransferase involved in cell wall biosynthesis